jgi:hypothetical protein
MDKQKKPRKPREGDRWTDEMGSPFAYMSGEWIPIDKLSTDETGAVLGEHCLVNCTGKWVAIGEKDMVACSRCGNIRYKNKHGDIVKLEPLTPEQVKTANSIPPDSDGYFHTRIMTGWVMGLFNSRKKDK